MTKCSNCGGTDIAQGKVTAQGKGMFDSVIFEPDHLRFLALTFTHGTTLDSTSYACLQCGTVFSQTNPDELRDFVRDKCKPPGGAKADS